MKNIIYFFTIAFLICFSWCQKCKDCSCSQIISQTGMPDVTQVVEINDVCDQELNDIEGTITYTQSVGGVSQSVEQTCECQ